MFTFAVCRSNQRTQNIRSPKMIRIPKQPFFFCRQPPHSIFCQSSIRLTAYFNHDISYTGQNHLLSNQLLPPAENANIRSPKNDLTSNSRSLFAARGYNPFSSNNLIIRPLISIMKSVILFRVAYYPFTFAVDLDT